MVMKKLFVAFALSLTLMEGAAAQTEGELANPYYRGDARPRRGWDGGGGGGGWAPERQRQWDPPPQRWRDPGYARPPIDPGPGCRLIHQGDGYGGQIVLRQCRVCEPAVVTDGYGNRYRENQCRMVTQRIG